MSTTTMFLLCRHSPSRISRTFRVAIASRYQSTRGSKVVSSAKEALEGVNLDGALVCVGGFGLGGNPETLLNELSRSTTAKNLTVASLTGGTDGMGIGLLIEAGMVKRLISSYVGENKHLESSFFGGTLEVKYSSCHWWSSTTALEFS